MIHISLHVGLSAVGIATLLALAGCAGAATDISTADSEELTTEETAEAPVIETACPGGFVDAYAAASIASFAEGVTFTEVTAAEFEPQFLAEFLDGGCAVHISGTSTVIAGTDIPVDSDYGFTSEDVADDIIAVLEEEGFVNDGSGVGFLRENPYAYAQVIVPNDDFHTNGDAAVQQYYFNGVVFTAG